MTKSREYLDDHQSNGLSPEEIAMMPHHGWGDKVSKYRDDDDDVMVAGDDQVCGIGPCAPGFLRPFRKMWVFSLLSALGSLFCIYVQTYLVTQVPSLIRQFDLSDNEYYMLVLPFPISILLTVLVLSVIARRVHIPRVIAVTSAIAGLAALLCIVPHIHSTGDMTAPPVVSKNDSVTIEKLQMTVPSCVMERIPDDLKMKMMIMMAKIDQDQSGGGGGGKGVAPASGVRNKLPPPPKPSARKTTTLPPVPVVIKDTTPPTVTNQPQESGVNNEATKLVPVVVTDPPTEPPTEPPTTTPEGSGVTIMMPDFVKLAKNPIYPNLIPLALGMGVDLEKVRAMSVPDQAKYVMNLPPSVQVMLPNLRVMLGPNPDDYFFPYELPKERRRRSTKMLEVDMMYSGALSQLMKSRPPIPAEVHWQLFEEACPFNTHPFHEDDHSPILLAFFILGMVFNGIAIAPRISLVVTFIYDNSNYMDMAKHLGIYTGVAGIGYVLAFLLGVNSMMTYITLEDTGYMTFLNPRWLPAWWLGFLILGLLSCALSLPMMLFPRKLMVSRKYSSEETGEDNACGSWLIQEIKGILPSMHRLLTNGTFLLLLVGMTLSHTVHAGLLEILINYVSNQFSLEPAKPGILIMCLMVLIGCVGLLVGGFIVSKGKLPPLAILTMVVGLSVIVTVMQAANIGFGCDQPVMDRGEKIVKNASTTEMCSQTCVCSDLGYSPVCGSDGITYYSPCHAGCGYPYDGKFHDCKCIEDQVRTATPDVCDQSCSLYYAFFIAILIAAFAVGMRTVPIIVSFFRCIESRDIPASMGLMVFFFVLFSHIIGPNIYQHLDASSCTMQRPKCGIMPTCAIYDNATFRLQVFITSTVLEAVAALLFFFAFLLGRRPSSRYNEKVHDKSNVKA